MDIYITEKETGTSYGLAMLPEKVRHAGEASFRTYDIINVGEVKLPNGSKLLTFSWSGTFPGSSRQSYSFIKSHLWRPPAEMESIFERWRQGGTVLNLMVTETWINQEVLCSSFDATAKGGHGDVDYSVTFIQNRDIKVYTVSELNNEPVATTNHTFVTASRPEPAAAQAKTYTVKSGDSLWKIAQQYLGAGSKYGDIYALNKGTIGSNPNLIKPGQVLTLPT